MRPPSAPASSSSPSAPSSRSPSPRPTRSREYVDVFDLGLILIWTGILVFITQGCCTVHGARAAERRGATTREDQWYDNDVHRPGYAGETRRSRPSAATSSRTAALESLELALDRAE